MNLTHLSSKVFKFDDLIVFSRFLLDGKTLQNLSVSSPAPVTIVCPDGFIAKNNTLLVCPVKVVTFSNVGYFQTIISLFEYPWVETSYFVVLENIKLQTWEPVSMLSSIVPLSVFQNLIVLSADPPPEANNPWLCGLHANPLTAAQWSLNLWIGVFEEVDHIINLLSLPPEASWFSSNDHFKPHTYWVWLSYLRTTYRSLYLISLKFIHLSREPVAIRFELHANELTLSEWPPISVNLIFFTASQI